MDPIAEPPRNASKLNINTADAATTGTAAATGTADAATSTAAAATTGTAAATGTADAATSTAAAATSTAAAATSTARAAATAIKRATAAKKSAERMALLAEKAAARAAAKDAARVAARVAARAAARTAARAAARTAARVAITARQAAENAALAAEFAAAAIAERVEAGGLTCPISRKIIPSGRAVRLSTTPQQHYEIRALVRWVCAHSTCPLTRVAVGPRHLLPALPEFMERLEWWWEVHVPEAADEHDRVTQLKLFMYCILNVASSEEAEAVHAMIEAVKVQHSAGILTRPAPQELLLRISPILGPSVMRQEINFIRSLCPQVPDLLSHSMAGAGPRPPSAASSR
jgi:hypothetical protein